MAVIWVKPEAEYFSKLDWTGKSPASHRQVTGLSHRSSSMIRKSGCRFYWEALAALAIIITGRQDAPQRPACGACDVMTRLMHRCKRPSSLAQVQPLR
jgi:hypothetical protein